jgi:hypothetical protein
MASAAPTLPTYLNAAGVLERKTGSGVKLAAWTVARTLLIAPPFLVVGVPAKQAWGGAALASVLISGLTLLRIFHAGENPSLAGTTRRRLPAGRRPRHRR